jgi:hypothetical protein
MEMFTGSVNFRSAREEQSINAGKRTEEALNLKKGV